MPVYELLGGKCREAAACYVHADGSEPKEIEENVRKYVEQGYHHIRVQAGGYGGRGAKERKPEGAPSGAYYDPKHYMRAALNAIEHVRNAMGKDIEILHDIHE